MMLDVLIRGGWVMLPLVFCSIVAITIVAERAFFFRHIAGALAHADKVIALISQGQSNEAISLLKGAKAPLLRVLSAGIAYSFNPSKAMEAAALAEASVLRRGLPALDTIITLSPLLGLLGTIIGMIGSFQIMSSVGMGQPHAVTGGVAEALIATATGITVAVITLVPYNYFLARIEKETELIEHYATRLELVLSDQRHFRSDKHEDTKKFA
jgi:biopolymer transport protein ExbB